MEEVTVEVKIQREDGDEKTKMIFYEDKITDIILSDESVNDLESFFNNVFMFILNKGKIIKFDLEDSTDDIYGEVANDIVDSLNSEILQSKNNFEEFCKLIEEKV